MAKQGQSVAQRAVQDWCLPRSIQDRKRSIWEGCEMHVRVTSAGIITLFYNYLYCSAYTFNNSETMNSFHWKISTLLFWFDFVPGPTATPAIPEDTRNWTWPDWGKCYLDNLWLSVIFSPLWQLLILSGIICHRISNLYLIGASSCTEVCSIPAKETGAGMVLRWPTHYVWSVLVWSGKLCLYYDAPFILYLLFYIVISFSFFIVWCISVCGQQCDCIKANHICWCALSGK